MDNLITNIGGISKWRHPTKRGQLPLKYITCIVRTTLKSRPMDKWTQKGSLNSRTPNLKMGSPKLQQQTPTLEEATMSNDKSRWQSQFYPLIGHLYPQTTIHRLVQSTNKSKPLAQAKKDKKKFLVATCNFLCTKPSMLKDARNNPTY